MCPRRMQRGPLSSFSSFLFDKAFLYFVEKNGESMGVTRFPSLGDTGNKKGPGPRKLVFPFPSHPNATPAAAIMPV